MALRDLIIAAQALESARQRIVELKAEKEKAQARIAAINDELAASRADSDAAIAKIKTEAVSVIVP